ncbi:hypothetical protein Hanom_Chr14g01258461 [Helianthus anomalus]
MLTLEPFSEDQGRSAVHPTRGIPPISFLAPCGFTHPLTRTHVRLLGPCFKTGRMGCPQAGSRSTQVPKHAVTARATTHDRSTCLLQFNDQETNSIELAAGTVEAILPRLSYEGKHQPLVKKFVHPYWRLLLHMFILCMTENRGGTDQLNSTQAAALACVITNEPFNYSKYILEAVKRNVLGVRKDKFLMYPRFLQMIFNARYPELERSGNTLELKPMGPACFGLISLEKFGQFAETEVVAANPVVVQPVPVNVVPANAIVAEEHDIQRGIEDEPETEILTINSDDEGVEIMCDSGEDEELPPEAEADTAVSTVPLVISAENLALLLKSVTDKMGNPPSNLTVSNEEPEENTKGPNSLPLKRKRRDPRLGMYVEQNKDQSVCAAEDDDGLYDFDFEKNVTDTTTTTEDIFECSGYK